jgi:hypothetical protein
VNAPEAIEGENEQLSFGEMNKEQLKQLEADHWSAAACQIFSI